MPQLHMPLQSGSDKVLRDMKRSYRSTKFLGILDKVREKIPHAAISTDIIVGFPGETEEDFQATLDVVEQSRFATAFTFQYSKRPGTPAADLPDQLPKAVVQERFERLTALQDRIAAEENATQLGRRVEVMVTAHSGRKSEETHRLSGRSQDQRLVHFSVPEGQRCRVRVTWSPSPSPKPQRSTSWPTRRCRTTACGVPARGTPGTGPRQIRAALPCRLPQAGPDAPESRWGCPRCRYGAADRWSSLRLLLLLVPQGQVSPI
ncbi:(Dimethylallyl)adenosine tRNA methylthiotransferase MiaB [Arthrobacter sp. Hiyo4]|nr:(Dimethylallyl)adenosine tRNA methylthiotransferase MiaB [Arthrobacter sp. Hiyo4]